MKTKASIQFGLIDVTAKEDSSLVANNRQNFVDLNDLKKDDLEEIKYGTLEKNQFALDGSFELMPENLENMCWWSNEMSNENGQFVTPLILEISFTKVHSSLGMTLIFSETNDYCNFLNIKYYDANNELISDKDFHPDNYKFICNNIIENYKRIVITFYSTNNPCRYLKLYKIFYGADKVFEGENLISANILEEVDLLSSEISINTLDFTVHSDDDEFNLINPNGVYKVLQKKQKFKVTEKLIKQNKNIEMGTFYLDEWSNEKDKIMKFKAIDLIGVIDKTTFYGGMYKDITANEVVKEIMISAGTEDDYEIQEELKNIKLTGYIPICSHRAALQQVAFAIGAVVDCSRSDKIKIYSLSSITTKKEINKGNRFEGTRQTSQMEIVTGISMTLHNYEKYDVPQYENDWDINLEDFEELCSYTITEYGIHILTFNEPAWDIVSVLDVSTSQLSNVTIDNNILQKNNCNSATINFDKGIIGWRIAIGIAKEVYAKTIVSSMNDVYFSYDGFYDNRYYVSSRKKSDTSQIDQYRISLEDNSVISSFDSFEPIIVEPNLKITIYGHKYKHSETKYQANIKDVVNVKGDNILDINSAYFINTRNMKEIGHNILNYYNNSYLDNFEFILDSEKVSDLVETDTNFNQNLIGNIASLDIDLTGGFLAKTKIISKIKKEGKDG